MVLSKDVNIGGTVVIAYQLLYNSPVTNGLVKYMLELRSKRRGFYPSLEQMQFLVDLEKNVTGGNNGQLNAKALQDLHIQSASSKLAPVLRSTN